VLNQPFAMEPLQRFAREAAGNSEALRRRLFAQKRFLPFQAEPHRQRRELTMDIRSRGLGWRHRP
jgi:hypothetical protein